VSVFSTKPYLSNVPQEQLRRGWLSEMKCENNPNCAYAFTPLGFEPDIHILIPDIRC
jgi:hypothetical protein